jgi:FMN phosphatase YigB (HAD superfamily)
LDVENAINYPLSSKRAAVTLVLFDLDDTLLGNEMNVFVPAYLQALARRMSQVAEPGILVRTLMSATRQMVEDTSPDQTLEDKFDKAFYPALGLNRNEVQDIIDGFYAQDFPKLKGLTEFKPLAVSVVHQLLERGDSAAIATNPLFPLTAIEQRLSWAGLLSEQIHFALVPSYETFHFAKPNPEFYAEYLAQLGWPKMPVLMVGNDIESDMVAARKLGLTVFWMNQNGSSAWNGQGQEPPHGDLADLIPWIETSAPGLVPTNFHTPEALLAILRSTPAALASLIRQKPNNLSRRPALDEWSPGEVLCHLRDVDTEVNLYRLRKVLDETNPFIPGQDTDPWAAVRRYDLQDGRQALADFTTSRMQVLRLLEGLSEEGWNRPARHAIFGPTTVLELTNIIAGHDILHVQQAYKAL